ncbi:retroviral-like aspartic protease family protein [Desulfoferrobacter suflitae]|uniref:retroviral-like aspartic protease family protein n=1 Tax=Desulfoferrobacter suflitae TaxID=2865782 RepID=UPI00216450FD|nr:retroviral-like aspartic protease family protein [Desulfoferrobacter suflitae]MCK8603324.1 retroviral-like aspartic protease family protein [Desulfoferrobacter suflitae]
MLREYPFHIVRPGDIARPYLPITITNPSTGKEVRVYALVDTGADECAFPASFAPILDHNLQAGQVRRIGTGNGITVAYGHTTRIAIEDFSTQDVLVDFMPNLSTPLLGVKSFLCSFVLTIDYPKKTFSLLLPNR